MLSLQMLRIMDNLWQAEGLDLRQAIVFTHSFYSYSVVPNYLFITQQ